MKKIPDDRTRRPTEAATNAWTMLTRTQQGLLAAIEGDLRDADMPQLSWYDVLLELSREESGRLRPYQIEERTLLTQYNLSRLIDRLEAAGLVSKEPFGDDGRGRVIALTERGRDVRSKAWDVYGASIASRVGSKLTEDEAGTLAALLSKLRAEKSA
jgi:DNA-binding MarR family transcriptional regulator